MRRRAALKWWTWKGAPPNENGKSDTFCFCVCYFAYMYRFCVLLTKKYHLLGGCYGKASNHSSKGDQWMVLGGVTSGPPLSPPSPPLPPPPPPCSNYKSQTGCPGDRCAWKGGLCERKVQSYERTNYTYNYIGTCVFIKSSIAAAATAATATLLQLH
jgi:hypothetical protein